jgi:hypothetical protein
MTILPFEASTAIRFVTVKVMTVIPTGTLEVESEWCPAKCEENSDSEEDTANKQEPD